MAAPPSMLTDREMDCITTVFRSFETGLRGATIYPSVSAEHCDALYHFTRHVVSYVWLCLEDKAEVVALSDS